MNWFCQLRPLTWRAFKVDQPRVFTIDKSSNQKKENKASNTGLRHLSIRPTLKSSYLTIRRAFMIISLYEVKIFSTVTCRPDLQHALRILVLFLPSQPIDRDCPFDMEVKHDAGKFLASCFHPHNRSLVTDILSDLLEETTTTSPFWPETACPSHYSPFRHRSLRTQMRLVDFWVHMIEEHRNIDCGVECIQAESRRERAYRLAHAKSQAQLCEALDALTTFSDLEVKRAISSMEKFREDHALLHGVLQILAMASCRPVACEKTFLDNRSESSEEG